MLDIKHLAQTSPDKTPQITDKNLPTLTLVTSMEVLLMYTLGFVSVAGFVTLVALAYVVGYELGYKIGKRWSQR